MPIADHLWRTRHEHGESAVKDSVNCRHDVKDWMNCRHDNRQQLCIEALPVTNIWATDWLPCEQYWEKKSPAV